MKIYAAPMEGVTGYVYRNAHRHYFQGIDKYYTPFLTPKKGKGWTSREKNDIAPEHNRNMTVVPQILTNQAEDFVRMAEKLADCGYEEINLNLGCPSGTVVSKGKGAGFLARPQMLEAFLEEIFSAFPVLADGKSRMEISIKTRLGMEEAEEFLPLMEMYRRYPLKELIIHPRVREDYYANRPDWDAFERALSGCPFPVVYNGDLDRKSTRLNSSHKRSSRMPSSA